MAGVKGKSGGARPGTGGAHTACTPVTLSYCYFVTNFSCWKQTT